MKKNTTKKNRRTKAAITATLMAVPMFGIASNGLAQVSGTVESQTEMKAAPQKQAVHIFLKYETAFQKFKGDSWIAGVGEGHSIYQNSRGEFFYIDPTTGDQRMVSSDYFLKMDSHQDRKSFVLPHVLEKTGAITNTGSSRVMKDKRRVTLLGVDEKGNIIQSNPLGEKFYLNPTTGDMVFVK
jgi:hypothetical protein